jgi:hypothetical protein
LLHSSEGWSIVSFVAHIPIIETDDQKVYRIAKELDISLEDAEVTCAGFELAFSDDGLRRSIFGMIDELDGSAAKKGEPLGLIINYTVELGMDGIRVGRYADEIPPGQIVSLTPTDRAMIFLRIKDNFPTQQFLGPLIVNRPEQEFASESCDTDIPTDLPAEWARAVICEPTRTVICLGPIRHTFNERFPFVSGAVPGSQLTGAISCLMSADLPDLNSPHHLQPWAALPAGMPAFQSSGLSPPFTSENLGHSKTQKMS